MTPHASVALVRRTPISSAHRAVASAYSRPSRDWRWRRAPRWQHPAKPKPKPKPIAPYVTYKLSEVQIS
jgi:hypothetical protein